MQLRNPNMTGYEGDCALFASAGNKRMPPCGGVQKEAGKTVQVTITIDNRDNCGLTDMENMKKIKEINNIEKDTIFNICETIAAEIEFYEQILKKFRSKYGDLIEFESKLANAVLPEHPYWEESIEYRNAYEELESLKRMKGVFDWILNLLTQQKYSSESAIPQKLPRT